MTELRDELQAVLGSSYTLERELGGGGMSRVFVAEQPALGRKVVVKVLPPEMSAGVSIDRFKREIMLAARLQHPHIVPVLTAGGSDALPYFTMPYIEGESLRAHLAERGELPIADGVRVLREIASALAYAHEHGIVHRDIKPDNVLLSGGAAMVTDFGVAKALSESSSSTSGTLTSLGIALGTPAYMSPEQASADPAIDHRADVYSFGALAYELLSGQPPFTGRSQPMLLAAHVTEVPESLSRRRPTVPPALAALVMRCLEKRPADRPQSATEIVHALDTIIIPSGGTSPHAVVTDAPNARRRSRSRLLVATAVVAAAILVAAFATWLSRRPDAATAQASSTRSIAVLPFENEGRDTAMAFFADGMTDQLATALSQAGIRVAGRASVGAIQAKGTSDAEAARILGVTMLLHGKVRRAGERLRVWAQLVNAKDGIALWTETYDTTLTDVFRVQDDVARLIVKELRPTLEPARVSASSQSARGTTDLQAYELFLKGRYYTDRLDGQRATEALTAAVARDPKYARAYAQLARAYSSFAFRGVGSSDSIHALERDAAERAVQLKPTLAEAHAAMGATLVSEWRFAEAEAEFKRGLALDPDSQDLNFEYCALLFDLGRASEALVQAERSLQHDPLSVGSIVLKSYTLVMMGRLDEARAATRAGLELDPTSVALYQNAGMTEAFGGRPDSALALLKKGYDLDPRRFGNAALLLFGYAVAGRWEDVDRVRAEIERDGGGNSPNFFRAMIAVVNGDRDSAVTYVERGFAGHEPLFLFVSAACDPMFDLIKSEPRFQALLERYGMRACPPFAKWPIPRRRT